MRTTDTHRTTHLHSLDNSCTLHNDFPSAKPSQVSFPITDASAAAAGASIQGSNLVAWTTTPWTLPSNLALCVHPEFEYVQVGFLRVLLFSSWLFSV